MPPKGKKGQAGEKGKSGDEERDEPLQAVVCQPLSAHWSSIADEIRYLQILSRPDSALSLSNDRVACKPQTAVSTCNAFANSALQIGRLPLANTPLIEYTFEFLANAGVEEVFVYCGAHREQVEEYIK
jgi:translation initiation factor eIF-2B subunit epsilon